MGVVVLCSNSTDPSGRPSDSARDVSVRNCSRDISMARCRSMWKSEDDDVT